MSGSPGTGGSNPRKFSEKIALHNQKQAEETRAFEQLMTDLNVSRVQFQKIQQLRLSQSRAPYYGGSLPNVNQIGKTSTDFQGGFPSGLDSVRGTRHHGLVERVHRERNRINSPHRRPLDKHGRQIDSSPYGGVYLSPPLDNNWRRTNSDSALHTSAMNPNPQNPFGMNQHMGRGPPQRNVSLNEAEVDSSGNAVFSFPSLVNEESLIGVSKPLPKQLWEAKKVQSLASRPKSCEVPGINIFPSPEQNPGLCHYQGLLNTGGSLPDLSNLHFPSPLSTPLDPEDNGAYPNLSGGSSTGNLPAAMMHLGIGNSQGGHGLSSSLSNPSIQASLNNCQLQSSLSNPSINSSLRLSNSSPRRRPAPISPLTLSPGSDQRRGLAKQLSPTMSPLLSPITQGVALDTSNMPREPPPPYPLYQQSQHGVDKSRQCQQQQQPVSPLQNISLDFTNIQQNNMAMIFADSFMEQQFSNLQSKALPYQVDAQPAAFTLDQFALLENAMNTTAGGSCFDPSASSSLYYSQAALSGLGGSHGSLQDPVHMRSNMLYSNCSGGLPNIILTDDSNPSLSKDISSALSTVPECFDSEGVFPLEDELRIEPLSLDGLSMLSDPDMVLPDPSVEDTFRSDRL
ncbi:CREB-regulated transcription coactivator 3 isoform X5 [Takifugu rubripes]|uniref:CREB-regulated transcription coactivator 3 isoform X5 n=1 Tax=Takifugu rubripes TaxID=31033 RepID=UPI0005D24A15|nr:CREB-regulated transcription coactivator 3 isoform X5 [Takifugu rubripes]|eukprot:XP_011608132.1 PREDICTED: CREB-regulated transcription coactivator 3 isoform X3 [Takifugu rubripes]